MELSEFFPMWDQLPSAQRQALSAAAQRRHVKAGAVLHRGAEDCLGLLLIEAGQLRAYLLSSEGREVTVYRLNAVAVHTFLLDGPEPLLRHLGLSEADTYITKHDIDDLVTVARIIREEAPAWQH